MSWIREEYLKMAYVIRVMSIIPKAMSAVQELNGAITFGGSTLTRVQEEAIATTVSVVNRCRF